MLSLRNLLRRLRSVQSGEEEGLRRGADNVDALAATHSSGSDPSSGMPAGIPPNYIKTYDEGRPRH